MSDSFTILWIAIYQAPLSMGFSWQEHWSALPFSSPTDLPDPGIKLASPACISCTAGSFFTAEPNVYYVPATVLRA